MWVGKGGVLEVFRRGSDVAERFLAVVVGLVVDLREGHWRWRRGFFAVWDGLFFEPFHCSSSTELIL